MPASIQNLYTQSRSLQAYTQALQTTGKNISSSADPNYARQQVTMQSALPASVAHMQGSAVSAGIKDTRDELVGAQLWREQSDLNFQQEQVSYLEQLELSLFSGSEAPLDLGAEGGDYLSNGLVRAISDFFSAWPNLEASSEDTAAMSTVYHNAQTLVDRFHSDAESMEDMRSTLTTGISDSVETVNNLLDQVAALQKQVGRMPTETTSSKMDLLTARDRVLSELSEYIPFSWTSNNSAPLESTLTVRMSDGSNVDLITGSQVNDTFNWDGTQLTLSGNGGEPSVDRGSLGGKLHVLNNELADMEDHWNLIANEMVTQVNARYNPTGTAGDFFVSTSGMAGSIELALTSSSDVRASTGSGGNDIAKAMSELAKTDLRATSNLSGTFANDLFDQQHQLANRISHGRDQLSAQEKVVSFLEQEISNSSGVDLDAEVTNLLQFQRSFQATSRVLRALDESIQTFLSDIA